MIKGQILITDCNFEFHISIFNYKLQISYKKLMRYLPLSADCNEDDHMAEEDDGTNGRHHPGPNWNQSVYIALCAIVRWSCFWRYTPCQIFNHNIYSLKFFRQGIFVLGNGLIQDILRYWSDLGILKNKEDSNCNRSFLSACCLSLVHNYSKVRAHVQVPKGVRQQHPRHKQPRKKYQMSLRP